MNFLDINWQQFGDKLVSKFFEFVLVSLVFFILYYLSTKIVKKLYKNYSERNWTDTARILTFSRVTTSAIHYVTVFLYIYTVLGIFGIPVGNILAGAGIFGVALGFAGRDLVSDIINGFFIIVEHQINVGDTIRFENLDIEGIVKSVGIRSITLTATDGAVTFVPNRNIQSVKNFSYGERTITIDVPVNTDNIQDKKSHILSVNEKYPQVKYMGIVNVEDKILLRNLLTAPLSDLTRLKLEILDQYFEK